MLECLSLAPKSMLRAMAFLIGRDTHLKACTSCIGIAAMLYFQFATDCSEIPRSLNRSGRRRLMTAASLMSLQVAMIGCHGPSRFGSQAHAESVSTSRFANEPLVELTHVDARIKLDIRYATSNNFLGRSMYSEARCFLRRSVAEKLRDVQNDLAKRGMGLVVFDGYRPLEVQREMWRIMPDPDYVADPAKGSRHNRGAAVDLALVDLNGNPLRMPTDFDDFTPAAHRDAPVKDPIARTNREILTKTMKSHGFVGLSTEWWHFDIVHWREYPIILNDADAEQLKDKGRVLPRPWRK